MKKLLKKYWPIFGLVFILLIAAYYLIIARSGDIKDSLVSQLIPAEGIKLENIHYIQQNPEEGMKWTLDAREVSFSKDQQNISFKDFHLRLEPENRAPMELSGQGGKYSKSLHEIQLWGKVRGVFEDGYQVETERLLYQQREGILKSDDYIQIAGPFFSLKGKGLRLDLKRKTILVQSDVKTVVNRKTFKL